MKGFFHYCFQVEAWETLGKLDTLLVDEPSDDALCKWVIEDSRLWGGFP